MLLCFLNVFLKRFRGLEEVLRIELILGISLVFRLKLEFIGLILLEELTKLALKLERVERALIKIVQLVNVV